MKQQLDPIIFGPNDSMKTGLLKSSQFMRTIVVQVSYAITWAAGGVTLFTDAIARSINIQVFLDGTGASFQCSGDVWKNYLTLMDETLQDYTEIGAGAGAQTGTWNFVIPFADPRMPEPDDLAYDLALAPQGFIQFNFNGMASMTATALGASAVTTLTFNVTLDLVQRPTGLPAVQTRPIRRWKEYAKGTATDFPAGSTDKNFQLDVGQIVRRMLFQTRESSSATRAYADTLLTGMQWNISSLKYGLAAWIAWRTLTRHEQQFAPPTGIVVIDFDQGAVCDPANMLNLAGVTQANMALTTAAALANGLEISVFEERILPLVA